MSKVKINGQEFEFKFGFKQIKELIKHTGKDLDKLEEVAKDFKTNSFNIIIFTPFR